MNIFITFPCPVKSAVILDDRRLIKMILESAQLLSTAVFLNSNQHFPQLYKPTHKMHPCTIWASSSVNNWKWLYKHLKALCKEYNFRFAKIHKTENLLDPLWLYKEYLPKGKLAPFINCTYSAKLNVDFRDLKDVCEAYKKYLIAKWRSDNKPNWTKRGNRFGFQELSLL